MMGTKRKLPFGYKMESGRIAVDTAESHWVTHLFSRYNMGVSVQELANFMNDTAVRYDPNKPWNKNMVARILADMLINILNLFFRPLNELKKMRPVKK